MSENTTDQTDQRDQPDAEDDVEGHNMLMYEQARTLVRQREQDLQKHAREARLLEDRKNQKR